jgi:hypothetical protein|tara:strand:+ start:852 stop:1577 length:726 start_codon:yes stop_codon:yes gene_type:complete
MAINIDQVYKTVLVILEQEKRGVLTPTEFGRVATQSQQEVFTAYFDELNQLLRMPQTSLAYADRMALLDEKISLFKKTETLPIVAPGTNPNAGVTATSSVQELGSVIYIKDSNTVGREVQRIQQQDVFTTNQSPLTAPTAFYPVYTYENKVISLYPYNLTGEVQLNYLKFPEDPKWGFTIDPELGNYIYNIFDSTDFELHESDQPLLVDKILSYAGVMSKDQFAMSLSSQKEQQINADSQK